jgi:tetratricopeptide (TPR) repeat protein
VTEDRKRARRLLALAGMWLLLGGLLTALGLVVVVFAASALMLVASLALIGFRQLRRPELRDGVRTAAGRTTSALHTARERAPRPRAPQIHVRAHTRKIHVREHARELRARAKMTAAAAPARTEDFATRAFQAMYRFRLLRLHSIDPGQRAHQLNALGAQLRRDGEPEQAAEQHLAALAIVRDLGDSHAEAMTLNNLGLALAHGGSEDAAVQHLEEARDVLRDLGDEEYEARVIANLGLVHRRQGHDDEAVSLLHEALGKLPPESQAYRQVEEELLRAS